MPDPWYPPAADYFVPLEEDDQYPVRQGDVFGPPPWLDADGPEDWVGSIVVHPSCELNKAQPDQLQVARIHAMAELPHEFEQASVAYGFRENDGVVSIAFAHTFWLPPAADTGPLSEPCFVNFREILNVTRDHLAQDRRVRAMTHEARLYFIRRKIYFRYRWNIALADVRRTEAQRIKGDSTFEGPRPVWAS